MWHGLIEWTVQRATWSFKILGNTQPTTQHHILEDMHPHQHHCKNAASHKTMYLQKAVHGLPLYSQVVQIKLLNAKGLLHHMQDSVQCLVRQLYVTGSKLGEPSVVLQSTDYWHNVPEHNTTSIYIIHPHLLRISQNIFSVCLIWAFLTR